MAFWGHRAQKRELQYRIYLWILLNNNNILFCSVAGRSCAEEASSQSLCREISNFAKSERYQPKGPGIAVARIFPENVHMFKKNK